MTDLELSLFGRLSFDLSAAMAAGPTLPPLPPGRNQLGIAEERDAVLVVPEGLDPNIQVPLVVLFHGGGGSAEKVLPMMEEHALEKRFLLLVPQSQFVTWDIVIAGSGPDIERLDRALAAVAARYRLDPAHIAFAGWSDGASYALTIGLSNGRFVTHILAFSGGFMTVLMPEGAPRVFISHGLQDQQLPIETSGRKHARQLEEAGYDVRYVVFNGPHKPQPPIIAMAVDAFLADG
jgi:predicted esterase